MTVKIIHEDEVIHNLYIEMRKESRTETFAIPILGNKKSKANNKGDKKE